MHASVTYNSPILFYNGFLLYANNQCRDVLLYFLFYLVVTVIYHPSVALAVYHSLYLTTIRQSL